MQEKVDVNSLLRREGDNDVTQARLKRLQNVDQPYGGNGNNTNNYGMSCSSIVHDRTDLSKIKPKLTSTQKQPIQYVICIIVIVDT